MDRYSAKSEPRCTWLFLCVALQLVANILLEVFLVEHVLWIVIPLAGIGLGSLFTVAPVATTDIFGLNNFAKVWGFVALAPAVAAIVCSTLIAGGLTDREAQWSSFSISHRPFCLGSACFRVTFLVTLGCSLAAAVIATRLRSLLRKGTLQRIASIEE